MVVQQVCKYSLDSYQAVVPVHWKLQAEPEHSILSSTFSSFFNLLLIEG